MGAKRSVYHWSVYGADKRPGSSGRKPKLGSAKMDQPYGHRIEAQNWSKTLSGDSGEAVTPAGGRWPHNYSISEL